MLPIYNRILPLLLGWFADRLLGDPEQLPHPVVMFGRLISDGEKRLNKGNDRKLKGGLLAVGLILLIYAGMKGLLQLSYHTNEWIGIAVASAAIFFCLAGKTLIREVQEVFAATDRSTAEGRKQLSRIVGRDTSNLSDQQIRTAALETLAENLSDGVIAPLFWFCILGVPGMMAYKMVNTLDSMIGYKNDRYREFGYWAAKIDDAANYVPARLTALLMLLSQGIPTGSWQFVRRFGRNHASPNSGYPEAALAALLNARFGGPNYYFGQLVEKPYIGVNERIFTSKDMQMAVTINEKAEILMVLLVLIIQLI
ncbi:MAG: adenosylcobinamide-phosphate synthase CbiB [Bacteroidales bacterium]